MPYIAQVPNDLLTLDVDAWVIDTNSQHLLNDFFTGSTETTGDISATNQGGDGTIAETGETVTVPTAGGDITGSCIGPVVLSTANVVVGVEGLAGINVQVNDIEGHALRAGDGSTYIVSDQELAEDRLGATVSVNVLGEDIELVDVPLSEITSGLADAIDDIASDLGPVLGAPFALIAATVRATTDLGQTVIDRVTLNVAEGNGTLDVVCFARGTLIQTEHGPVAVEDLVAGMRIMTRDRGLQTLRWIGARRLGPLALMANPVLRPIRLRAGALAANIPAQDLIVSPQHRILIRSRVAHRMFDTDEVLVAAKQLLQLDGVDIVQDQDSVEYFHLLFDQHEIVISNGAETESLYTGATALDMLSQAARNEILAIFPELADETFVPESVRFLTSARQGRKLAVRHRQNGKALVQ
ncbi:Hint domain-containing protein [Paracoccus sp. DMF-8]|uniref:Hint domain-containing protein n=1 Tax=Paracoccus sp. DMF-8 TaxID=3019445 RepID=UPI0023E783D9|nr:Hint domain-containing protein [Paracoccus sp. DMF-8]MDF3606994.1 Hint domain-containing protein [Paracoccus sp. DMF-8]